MAARSKLIVSVESLGDVHIQREILQGGSLSPLLSTLCVITLLLILRKGAAPYEWGENVHFFSENIRMAIGGKEG